MRLTMLDGSVKELSWHDVLVKDDDQEIDFRFRRNSDSGMFRVTMDAREALMVANGLLNGVTRLFALGEQTIPPWARKLTTYPGSPANLEKYPFTS